MATTSIDLGEHYTSMLAKLKESGRYRNASEAIREALRLLEQKEAENVAKLNWLREQLEAGEKSGVSDRSVEDIFQGVKAKMNA